MIDKCLPERFCLLPRRGMLPEHDPEKWMPVFRKDRAPLKS
jgi:hypothetical protein